MGLVLHQFRFDAGILPTAAMAKQDDDTSNCCEKGRAAGNGVVRRTYFRLRDRRRWSREGEGDAMAGSGQTDLVARVWAETCSDEEGEATDRLDG